MIAVAGGFQASTCEMPPDTLEFEEPIAVLMKEIEALSMLPQTPERQRSIDALNLPMWAVSEDAAGAPYLRYLNHKLRRERYLPIKNGEVPAGDDGVHRGAHGGPPAGLQAASQDHDGDGRPVRGQAIAELGQVAPRAIRVGGREDDSTPDG